MSNMDLNSSNSEDCYKDEADLESPGDNRKAGKEEEEEEEDGRGQYPSYCRTLRFTDASGQVKELVLPRALDLDRPKRARTTFSPAQLGRLEAEFGRNQYVVGRERTLLAQRLSLSETQVKVWFQNRRTKYKRDKTRESEEGCGGPPLPSPAPGAPSCGGGGEKGGCGGPDLSGIMRLLPQPGPAVTTAAAPSLPLAVPRVSPYPLPPLSQPQYAGGLHPHPARAGWMHEPCRGPLPYHPVMPGSQYAAHMYGGHRL